MAKEKMKKSLLLAAFFAVIITSSLVIAFVIQGLAPITVDHGTSGSGIFDIDNTYAYDATSITCSATGTYGSWVSFTNCPTTIPASGTYPVNFGVAVPSQTASGVYTIPLTIEGMVNAIPRTDTENLQVTVPASPSLIITSGLDDMEGYAGDDVTGDFTIKNNGNTVLNNIQFSYNADDLEDDDGDAITLDFDPSTFNLNAGADEDVEVTADIDNDMDYGTYSTTVTATSGSATASFSFAIRVKQEFCDAGDQGTRVVLKKIEEPDSGDEFRAGETISVEVDIKNEYSKEIDVVLEARLFDIDDDVYLDEAEAEISIDEDETETLEVDLEIPADIDSGNSFIVLVKVYEDGNEDDQCKDDFVPIEITKDKHSVLLDKVTMTPDPVGCGDALSVQLTFVNAGKNDEDEVMVRIYNFALDIDEDKVFSLDEGDDYKATFNSLNIPKDAEEKDYIFTVEWFYDYDDGNDEYDESDNTEITVSVEGNCKEQVQDALLSVQQLTSAKPGEEFSVKVTLTNTGTEETTYTITASGYESWASLTSIEPTSLTLDSEETGYSYIKLQINQDATGSQSFTVKATFADKTKTQGITANVVSTTEGAQALDQLWFSIRHNFGWFLINVVLVVAIIVLIILLARRGRSRQGQVMVVGGNKKPAEKSNTGHGPTEISLAKSKPKAARKATKTRRKRRRK